MTRSEVLQVLIENPRISVFQLAKRLGVSWWQCRRFLKTHQIQLHVQRGRPPKAPRSLPGPDADADEDPRAMAETVAPRVEVSPPAVVYTGQGARPAIDPAAPVTTIIDEQTDRMQMLARSPAPMEMLLILLQSGSERYVRPPLFKIAQRAHIGRDPQNDIPVIADSAMSRVHAVIQAVRGSFLLRDMTSTNGTFVNSAQISVYALQDGDEVRIGNTFFLVQLQAAQLRSEPTAARPGSAQGTALIDWRRQQGLTQTELARRLQVSQRAISMWENGHPISHDNQVKLRQQGCELPRPDKD